MSSSDSPDLSPSDDDPAGEVREEDVQIISTDADADDADEFEDATWGEDAAAQRTTTIEDVDRGTGGTDSGGDYGRFFPPGGARWVAVTRPAEDAYSGALIDPDDIEDDEDDEDDDAFIDPNDVEPRKDPDDDAGDGEQRPGVVTATRHRDATWSNARSEYETAGKTVERARTKRQIRYDARLLAAKTILYENEVATVPRDDNGQRGEMYIYDPETGLFEDGGEEELRALIEENLGQYVSQREKNEIVDKVYDRSETYSEEDDEWDAAHLEETLIPAQNGVIHVEALNDPDADVLKEYTPEMRSRWKLAVPFDPEMDAEDTRFVEFLKKVQPDDVQRRTILGFIGAALVQDAPDGFMMMVGDGSNGKTMIQTGVERLYGGSDADQVATEDLQDITQNRFARGQLINARVNLAPDISATRIEDASNLKKITGGDSMSAGRKHEQREQFESPLTLIASANEPPMLPSEKKAIKRRTYFAEFVREFEFDPDPDDPNELQARPENEVKEELYAEESLMGLLALAVQELAEVRETGEYRQGREMPPEDRFRKYEALADTAARFGLEILETDEGNQIRKDDMHQVYQRFAREQNETPMRKSAMTRTMENLEGLDVTTKRTRTFSSGDDRDRVFEHVSFSEDAREYMTDRIEAEYMADPADDDADDVDGDDADGSSTRHVDEAVLDVVSEMADGESGAPASMVTTTVAAALGDSISEGDVARAIDQLEEDARLYRPAEGELMPMNGETDDEDDGDGDDEDGGEQVDGEDVAEAVMSAVGAHNGAPTRGDVAGMESVLGSADARRKAVDELLAAGELEEQDGGLAVAGSGPGRATGGDSDGE